MILLISVKEQKEALIKLAVDMINKYIPHYDEMGLFGSVARGTYSASSDVDLYLVTDDPIDKYVKAELSSDLDEIGVDIVFLKKDDFIINIDHLLVKNVMRDRRIISKRGDTGDIRRKIL